MMPLTSASRPSTPGIPVMQRRPVESSASQEIIAQVNGAVQ